MPFRADHIYVRATAAARHEFEKDRALRHGLHWIEPEATDRSMLPAEGLLAVCDVVEPAYEDSPWTTPWDALWGPDSIALKLPDRNAKETPYASLWPPSWMLRRLAELARWCRTPVCYYRMQTHGGDVMHEVAWVFESGRHHLLNHGPKGKLEAWVDGVRDPSAKGDVLQRALERVGVGMPSGWFEPHTGPFDWQSRRCTPPPTPRKTLLPFPDSLYRSIQCRDMAAIGAVLARGIDPNELKGVLALAAGTGNLDIVNALLGAGATPAPPQYHSLSHASTVEIATALVSAGARLTHEPWQLNRQVSAGHSAVARWMIDQGVPVDAQAEGWALWRASCEGGLQWLAQRLLDQCPQLISLPQGADGLERAAEGGHLDMVKWMVGSGIKPNHAALVEAAGSGHTQTVAWLLDQGLDVHGQHHNRQALHTASWGGHLDVVELLLERGADPQATSWGGDMGIHRAALCGHTAVVERFLRAGVPVDTTDDGLHTPLWSAVGGGHQDTVDLLLAHGANPEHKNQYGTSIRQFSHQREVTLPPRTQNGR